MDHHDVGIPGCLRVRARIHGSPRWRPAVRRVDVGDDGTWRWQQRDGAWVQTRPDRLAIGLGGLWLHVAGPSLEPTAARRPRRVSATFWRPSMAARAWRRLQVAARWRMACAPLPVSPATPDDKERRR